MEENVIGIPSELLNVFWYATEGTEREQTKMNDKNLKRTQNIIYCSKLKRHGSLP